MAPQIGSMLPSATPALLTERPRLRFLAWQDDYSRNPPRGVFHADGSVVNDSSELRLLSFVDPPRCDASDTAEGKHNPRFLHLWFSHPLLDEQSLSEVTFLDGDGKPVPPGGGGLMAKSVEGAKDHVDRDDHLGWLTYTLSPGSVPPGGTVRLRYTLGPWEGSRQFAPDQNGIVALGNGSQLNGVGQDLEGKAFFAIAVDMKQDAARQFGVVVLTKDGRELPWSRVESGGGTGQAVQVQRFHYAVSLADIGHFRLSTRPVRTRRFSERVPAAGQESGIRRLREG